MVPGHKARDDSRVSSWQSHNRRYCAANHIDPTSPVKPDVWTSHAGSAQEGVMQRDDDFDKLPSFRDYA
jgi:hypothetical protein